MNNFIRTYPHPKGLTQVGDLKGSETMQRF